jgi:hypothetical protein
MGWINVAGSRKQMENIKRTCKVCIRWLVGRLPFGKAVLERAIGTYHRLLMRRHGEKILLARYRKLFSRDLDLARPRLFTDKLFCRMISLNRHDDPALTRLVDKFLVRDWVREKIGSEHLVPLFWEGTDPRAIDFDTLPQRCVIKTNHGSGHVIVKNGPIDRDQACRNLDAWLKENFYWVARERQYHGVTPRILIESFLNDDAVDSGPLDYKFWCFHGKPVLIQVDDHAHSINPFHDLEWNVLDLRYRVNQRSVSIPRPKNLEKMIEIASVLSSEFDFVRVDLYNIDGHVLFGEMTFTPLAGILKFEPADWDDKLGALWRMAA